MRQSYVPKINRSVLQAKEIIKAESTGEIITRIGSKGSGGELQSLIKRERVTGTTYQIMNRSLNV